MSKCYPRSPRSSLDVCSNLRRSIHLSLVAVWRLITKALRDAAARSTDTSPPTATPAPSPDMFFSLPTSLLLLVVPAVLGAPSCQLTPPKPALSIHPSVGNNNSSNNDEVIATTWYAGWHGTDFPPQNISWSKYSQVIYAFA